MMFHMRMSIDGALKNKAFKGFTDNDGNPIPPKIAEAKLRLMQYEGKKFLMMGDCDNWSEESGCLGHQSEVNR